MNNKKCPICGEKNYQLTSNGICPSCEVNLLIFVQDKMDKAQQYKDAASHADSPEDALQEWKQCSKVYQEVLDKYRGTGIDPFSILDPALSLRSVQDECMEKISCYEKMVAESVKSSSSQPVNNRFSFCPYCGNQLSEAFAFCPYCGKSVSVQENTCVPEPPKAQQPVTQQEEIEDEPKQSESFSDSSYSPPWEPTVQTSSFNTAWNKPEKKKWGCLSLSLLILGFVFILFLSLIFSENNSDVSDKPDAENQTASESQEESNGKIIFSEPYHPLYDQAYQNAAIAVKKYLSNPDSAYLKHNYSKFHISTGKFYNYGDITYKNSSGIEVKEPFETCIMITDKKVYPLYVKLGNNILLDDRDIVNDLGVVTAAGDSKYSTLKQGTVFYEGELVADWDENKMAITYNEYNQIKNGMDYSQVSQIVGSYGAEMSRVNVSGYESVVIAWDGIGSIGANANVTFQNGKVIAKAQFGLE